MKTIDDYKKASTLLEETCAVFPMNHTGFSFFPALGKSQQIKNTISLAQSPTLPNDIEH